MEFEDIQVIWNKQDRQPAFKIDHDLLLARLQKEAKSMHSDSNTTELLFVAFAGLAVYGYGFDFRRDGGSYFEIVSGLSFFAIGFYFLTSFLKRRREILNLDQSIRGILDSAVARYRANVKIIRRGILYLLIPYIFLQAYEFSRTAEASIGDWIFPDIVGLSVCTIASLIVAVNRSGRINKLNSFRKQLDQSD